MEKTNLIDGCTDFEIETYNTFASGYYPETEEMVRAYESFTFKVIQNPKITSYFNKEILIKLMAEKLCNGAYQAIEEKNTEKVHLLR